MSGDGDALKGAESQYESLYEWSELRPDEFIGVREAGRTLHKLIARLERGEAGRFVLVSRNKPRAVVTLVASLSATERAETK